MEDENEELNKSPKRKRKRVQLQFSGKNAEYKELGYGDNYQNNAASKNAKYLGEFKETWNHEF